MSGRLGDWVRQPGTEVYASREVEKVKQLMEERSNAVVLVVKLRWEMAPVVKLRWEMAVVVKLSWEMAVVVKLRWEMAMVTELISHLIQVDKFLQGVLQRAQNPSLLNICFNPLLSSSFPTSPENILNLHTAIQNIIEGKSTSPCFYCRC